MNSDALFIHVPKTGGRSILTACGERYGKHLTLKEHIDQLGEQRVDDMFKFTVVRNPWNRVFSVWRFFVRNDPLLEKYRDDFTLWIIEKSMTNKVPLPPDSQLDQMEWYKDTNGLVKIDTFLRFEYLDEDFERVKDRVGAVKPLGKVGQDDFEKSGLTSRNYRDYYRNDAAIQFIETLNKELIARFGYTY